MHPFGYGETSAGRNPRGAMWNTRSIEDLGREGLQGRILFVNGEERCDRFSLEVRSMPVPSKQQHLPGQ
jgi:hypothetical protein